MTPKSHEELIGAVDGFVNQMENRIKAKDVFHFTDMMDIVEYIQEIKNINNKEFVQLLIEEEYIKPDIIFNWVLGITGEEYGDEYVTNDQVQGLLNVMKKI